jgi:hypothetical protein
MTERFESYVADPAEPPPRPRLAGLAPTVWTLALLIALIGATTVFWQGRGEEDPALTVPGAPAEESAP